jgi:hypothetical protein
MNSKCLLIGAIMGFSVMTSYAQSQLPSKQDQEAFKRLAAQTVLHVERSLKKLPQLARQGDKYQATQQIELPARELKKDWKAGRYSDAVMFSYGWCPNALDALIDFAREAFKPPHYEQSSYAQQKLKYLFEDLAECKKLTAQVPDYYFAR